jgi:undecaprenyl-diphosphatase
MAGAGCHIHAQEKGVNEPLEPQFSGVESVPERSLLERAPLALVIALFAGFLFAWLAESVLEQRTARFDAAVRNAVHNVDSPQLTRLMFAVTFMGSGGLIVAALLAFALFRHFRWRGAAIWLLITLAGAAVLDLSLKWAFHRPRPTPFYGPLPSTYSFPSGHSLFSFCFYGVLAGLLAQRVRSRALQIAIWAVAVLLVFSIGLSRVYLGVHYPSDVLGGFLTGTIWVTTMLAFDHMRQQRSARNGAV